MFATRRLIGGVSGWPKQQTSCSLLLDKMWMLVNIEPLSETELKQVICTKYPQLSTIIEKILDVYFMLSSGQHEMTEDRNADEGYAGRFLSHTGRLISTRDLLNWCGRISVNFDVSSTATGNIVLQEALTVCTLTVFAEYICSKHKPQVQFSPESFCVGRVSMPVKSLGSVSFNRNQSTFSFTRQSCCILEKVAVCVARNEPVLLVGETGTGKTSSVQVLNMNQQSDSADLLGGFKPVDLRLNTLFLGHVKQCYNRRKWRDWFSLVDHAVKSACLKLEGNQKEEPWTRLRTQLDGLEFQIKQTEHGTLVQALKRGDWVLLDEINLAAAETLECLSGLLESKSGSVLLTERGDDEPIYRHEDFRLFACMNPATDVGKKDLNPGIRNRFTEMFVDELEEEHDLKILIKDYLKGLSLTATQIEGIVKFYLLVRAEAFTHLTDGSGHRPHFSLRTLCRALKYSALNRCGLVSRSLYEAFCMGFLTQLDRSSHPVVEKLIGNYVVGKSNLNSLLKQPLPKPADGKYMKFEGYWISVGSLEPFTPENYVLTSSVRDNLRDLARVVTAGFHPILLQGETSVGKTSLIIWLSQSSGNVCVRINNHEHTDLQEYIGCYAADETGKLVFKEGVLVEAMRRGHWVILDELNLAPTDVLEALNRVLDDNRELFIAETQETVKAHPKFMLFATQNPPGHYGGRKLLSRAFRNRFIELHFDEIPPSELETILQQRCSLPLSYVKRLVLVMLELQTRRKSSGVFAGKQGFITLRDLFRWADRYKDTEVCKDNKFYDWDLHLANHGYMLLAGRVRKPEEADIIQEVIQKHFKCKIETAKLFTVGQSSTTKDLLDGIMNHSPAEFNHIVWTHNMRRLAVLIGQAVKYKEPVLLIGDTGCGKTVVCQLYAALLQKKLNIVNCHLHTESADFLGGLRPVRTHDHEQDSSEEKKLFEWCDGPLVQAMKDGSMFLLDEISLADDSVLERLNSVLEPEQTLLLAEKGGAGGNLNDLELIRAQEGFQLFATMNPGGDFGKKELSPALRNRFTEIWCPQTDERQDLINIIERNLFPGIHLCNQEDGTSGIGNAIMDFIQWFTKSQIGQRCTVSIRDILTWVKFLNTTCTLPDGNDGKDGGYLMTPLALIHGACLVFLDGLESGLAGRSQLLEVSLAKEAALKYLLQQINSLMHQSYSLPSLGLQQKGQNLADILKDTKDELSIFPFSLRKGSVELTGKLEITWCGKTSLIAAIAKSTAHQLVRINLSEQTDISDLFGADLPVEGSESSVFAWRDGPFLQAMKAGHWIILDELNLASQSVLEGLNACLDHRGEINIPELGRTFHIQQQKTRLFACQNPLNQGGGRKGLPKSFLNRFTQVYVEPLTEADLLYIASEMYPSIPMDILSNMITFNTKIFKETMVSCEWGQRGSPWEFNLRDVFRWCDVILSNQRIVDINPGEYISLIYCDRMRSAEDKEQVVKLYKSIFPDSQPYYCCSNIISISSSHLQVGHSFLPRERQIPNDWMPSTELQMLHHCIPPLESVMKCIEMNWMTILVGAQSCGKTSLMQLLATLLGKELIILSMNSDMDTTELLGGFEQSDFKYLVEQCIAEVKKILTVTERELLLTGSKGAIADVMELERDWQKCKVDWHAGKISTSEEINMTGAQIDELLHLLKKLQHYSARSGEPTLDQTLVLGERLIRLKNVITSGIVTKGGTFEWNDSLLVQALKKGSWLLIDNVNFCSSSVLDRLNALLEPGGELVVNERGVVDGHIPTIKPHPDFRLFLIMDPKYGEISRAMRNRGVEIFISPKDGGVLYEPLDVKIMLRNCGLISQIATNWLISLQDELQSKLPHRDRPSIIDLLQVAVLVCQQSSRGVELQSSLWQMSNEVYVRSLRSNSSKEIAVEILTGHFAHLNLNMSTSEGDLEIGVTPYTIPSTTEICQNTELSNVKLHCSAFSLLVNKILLNVDQVHKAIDKKRIDRELSTVIHAAYLVIERSPKQNWKLHSEWLLNFMDNKKGLGHGLVSLTSFELPANLFIDQLAVLLENSMNSFFQHPLHKKIKKSMEQYLDSSGMQLLKNSSWDLRWNIQLFQRLMTKHFHGDTDTVKNHLDLSWNRLRVICKLKLEDLLYTPVIERIKAAVDRDGISGESVLHPSLPHLLQLFAVLEKTLIDNVSQLELSTYDQVTKTLNCFQWRKRMIKSAKRAVTDFSSQMTPDDLILHWNWFYDKMITYLFQSSSKSIFQSLQPVVNIIQTHLGADTYTIKDYVKFWKTWGHPAPYRSQREAECHIQNRKLCQLIDVYWDTANVDVKAKINVFASGNKILHKLMTVKHSVNITDLEYDQMRENLQAAKCHLQSLGLRVDSVEPSEPGNRTEPKSGSVTPDPVRHIQLWPVFEYVDVLASLKLLTQHLMKSEKIENKKLKIFMEYCQMFTPLSPNYLRAFIGETGATTDDLSCEMMASVLGYLWKSTSTCQLESWQQWLQNTDSNLTSIEISVGGPWCLHLSLLSHLVYSMLAAPTQKNCTSSASVQQHLSLGSYSQQMQQLCHLSTLLWSHSAVLSSPEFKLRNIETENILWIFQHFLNSIKPLVVLEYRAEFSSSVNQLYDLLVAKNLGSANFEGLKKILSIQERIPQFCRDLLVNVLSSIECICSSNDNTDYVTLGSAWINMGLLHMALLSPRGAVDPVYKQTIKMEYVEQEAKEIENELEVQNLHYRMMTGGDLMESSLNLQHPQVQYLMAHQQILLDKKAKLQQKGAFRPNKQEFHDLQKDIQEYMSTVGSERHINGLLSKLLTTYHSLQEGNAAAGTLSGIKEENLWQKIQREFLAKLEKKYPYHRDLTVPFSVGVRQVMHGLRLVCGVVSQAKKLATVLKNTGLETSQKVLEKTLFEIGRFPSITKDYKSFLELGVSYMSAMTVRCVNMLVSYGMSSDCGTGKQLLACLLHSAVKHIKNDCLIHGEITEDHSAALFRICNTYLEIWQEQENRKKQEREEKESLYRYTVSIHGDERTEEEIEESEFRISFPTFERDFIDLAGSPCLDGTEDDVWGEDYIRDSITSGPMSEEVLNTVCDVHVLLFNFLTRCDWLTPRVPPEVSAEDCVGPVLISQSVAAKLEGLSFGMLSQQVDPELLGGNLVLSQYFQQSITPATQDDVSSYGANYDIYCDPNVSEVVRCRPVLDHLVKKIQELQMEWPDHPTLVQLIEVVDRILSFPVTSPLMKFLTGLELLLHKAQDWESNAAKFVSMSVQLGGISELVIEWRKLELRCWNYSLDVEKRHYQQKARRWWFYLYQLISSYISTPANLQMDSNPNDVTEGQNILAALKKFMETATLGDFQSRLELLQAFHCQLTFLEKSYKQREIECMLWNVYMFYKQFSPSIETETEHLKKPIERELKGFVKIARWTDINYWALKLATEKTHRTVHKHIKAFKTVLQQPVLGILQEHKGRTDETQNLNLEKFVEQCLQTVSSWTSDMKKPHAFGQMDKMLENSAPLLLRIPSLSSRMQKHLCRMMARTQYGSFLISLDEFSGEVVEAIKELQSLDVTAGLDKEKQKSEAKHINLRKRKALADLFKYLSLLGAEGRAPKEGNFLNLSFKILLLFHPWMDFIHIWCETSLGRTIIFYINDIGPTPRGRGAGPRRHFSQRLLVQIQEGLLQFVVILQSAPHSVEEATVHPSPLSKSELSQMSLVKHGDEQWKQCLTDTQIILTDAKQMQQQVDRIRTKLFWTGADLQEVAEMVGWLCKSASVLDSVAAQFNDPATNTGCILNNTVIYLVREMRNFSEKYHSWSSELKCPETYCYSDSKIVKQFSVKVENLTASMLLAVQTLKKHQDEKSHVEEKDDTEEFETLKKGHLVEHLITQLTQDCTNLDCQKVINT
ncbi:hypothetical protein ScPMuIL_012321, partial [Solemya velum]